MKQGWDDYERAAEKGPLALAIKAVIGIAILSAFIGGLGWMFGWFTEAAAVAQKEFGAEEALRKYEWFKDAAAQLEKKQADIKVYETRLQALKADYGDKPRSEWAREDREQSSIWSSEVAGAKASYNTLAGQYNAQMSKFNWRFAEAGRLPEGATTPLPRDFKPYVEN